MSNWTYGDVEKSADSIDWVLGGGAQLKLLYLIIGRLC